MKLTKALPKWSFLTAVRISQTIPYSALKMISVRWMANGKISTISLSASDPNATGRFYTDIAQLTNRSTAGQVHLWDRIGEGAGLSIWPFGADPEAAARDIDKDPTVTLAVSNLRTALRQVQRRGGRVGKCSTKKSPPPPPPTHLPAAFCTC